MGSSLLIKIKEIKKGFKNKLVLNKLNLDIKEKEILGIIGESGAGKTTLLRLIVGFLQPEKGKIFLKTKNRLMKKNFFANKSIGFATQDSSFYPDLTVFENLKYFAALYDVHEKIEEKIYKVLRLVNLGGEENHLAKNLSDGMKKRLDIACALIHTPKMLILDEPTANIDITLKKQIMDLIQRINKQGTTIIISSHHLEEIEVLCDRIALIHDKKIFAIGTVDKLKRQFSVKKRQALDNVLENLPNIKK